MRLLRSPLWRFLLLCFFFLADSKFDFARKLALGAYGAPTIPVHPSACKLVDAKTGTARPHKVLVFVDSSFFSVFHNWLVYYKQACGNSSAAMSPLELVCMDEKVQDHLDSVHLQCSSEYSSIIYGHREKVKSRSALVWMKRLEIINAILSAGSDLILSDSDAFWLRSPYADLSRLAEHSHIIAQRGFFPFHLSRKWGSTLCMGFVYIRSSPFTLHFFDLVLRDMNRKQLEIEAYQYFLETKKTVYLPEGGKEAVIFSLDKWQADENKTPDDQFSANSVLNNMNISWPLHMGEEFRSHHHVGAVWFQGNVYNITLLAESQYVRNCLDNPKNSVDKMKFPTKLLKRTVHLRTANATVVHCLIAPGDSSRKQMYLVYYELWKLPYKQAQLRKVFSNTDSAFFRMPPPVQMF